MNANEREYWRVGSWGMSELALAAFQDAGQKNEPRMNTNEHECVRCLTSGTGAALKRACAFQRSFDAAWCSKQPTFVFIRGSLSWQG
ncbi:MAG: hypothetical protein U5K33_00285 [Halofilum sp. (in: g-proteobacteria)]|nr:hypothetical protein [Halofilum sp. (in: g-proteobacteria)]